MCGLDALGKPFPADRRGGGGNVSHGRKERGPRVFWCSDWGCGGVGLLVLETGGFSRVAGLGAAALVACGCCRRRGLGRAVWCRVCCAGGEVGLAGYIASCSCSDEPTVGEAMQALVPIETRLWSPMLSKGWRSF